MPGPNHRHAHGRATQGGRGRQDHDGRGGLPTAITLRYYIDEKKRTIDPALVDNKAIEWASSFSDLKTTQMRRFYDEFKAIERKILLGKTVVEQEANFQRDRASLMLFKAKAVYAEKRGVAPRAFTQFIFNHLASINDLKDFHAFIKVFEAVVAFHRFYAKDN